MRESRENWKTCTTPARTSSIDWRLASSEWIYNYWGDCTWRLEGRKRTRDSSARVEGTREWEKSWKSWWGDLLVLPARLGVGSWLGTNKFLRKRPQLSPKRKKSHEKRENFFLIKNNNLILILQPLKNMILKLHISN